MKNINLLLIFTILFASCQKDKKKSETNDDFEKSYKELKKTNSLPENTEHFDSISKIYSNFKYRVAFDAPDNWETDTGVSEHTIFRTFQADSAFTFSINVIEIKLNDKEKNNKIDIWDFYQENKAQMDYPFTTLIEEQLNTKIKDYKVSKSYIRNNVSVKRKFNYTVRNLDFEYENTTISYQCLLNGLTYTFALDVPSIFYDTKPEFYDNLFLNIYFLKDGQRIEDLLKQN